MESEIIARSSSVAALLRHQDSPHLGLVFERFPKLLNKAAKHFDIAGNVRRKWLDEFIDLAKVTSARSTRLTMVHARLDAVLRAGSGERRDFHTAGRFTTGLGNANAAEIGFSFDAACGVPALPGSAVKGLARAGAQLCNALDGKVSAVFGDAPLSNLDDGSDQKRAGRAGSVVFLDALPVNWPRWEVDIITCHHDAEAIPHQDVPLDADDPNPVHFLVVAPSEAYAFRLLPRRETPSDALSLAWTWLARALDELGAGAKTAVGYGQMLPA